MNQRLETLPWAAVAALKQEACGPGGLLGPVARRLINKVPGKPPAPLVRD